MKILEEISNLFSHQSMGEHFTVLNIFQLINFINKAQKSIFQIDQCVRNQAASFSRRLPSVLLISIIEFLTVYEIMESTLVCTFWHNSLKFQFPSRFM